MLENTQNQPTKPTKFRTKNWVEINYNSHGMYNTAVPLKYLSKFWRTLEMPLINCEINLILTWSGDCAISSATVETKFKITDTKLYVPVV